MSKAIWPAWFNGPNGQTEIFHSADEVPAGWTSGAEKRTASGQPASGQPAWFVPSATKAAAKGNDAETDAAGWPFDPKLHAATRTKTQAGLWRMKVGVSRPDAKPGFPKPVLDL